MALITGGGSGICFEVTRQLLLHGCRGAVICGRRANFLEKATATLRRETGKEVEYKVCDVRNPDMCQAAVDFTARRFGQLDILINGAAGNFLAQAKDLSSKGFATVMSIDTLGTFNMCRAAYSLLSKSPNGDASIINISATLQYGATHWQAHASAAKAAVDSLTRSLALEWGAKSNGIRCNGLAPGPIEDTPGTTKLAPGLGDEDISEMVTEGIPLGRMGKSKEIGEAVIYLCTAKYVTGEILVVDGGEWLYRPPLVPAEMVAELSRGVEAKSRQQAPRSRL